MLMRFLLIFIFSLGWLNQASALSISPDKPVVAVGQRITLTADGATGNVRWQAFDGAITGSGNQVTYIAPNNAGLDPVTIKDDNNSVMVNIVVSLPNILTMIDNLIWDFSPFNSFQRPELAVKSLLLSEDNKSLWVGTFDGLKIFDVGGGLSKFNPLAPKETLFSGSTITSLLGDGKGGVWIGTSDQGLNYYDANHKKSVLNTSNSGLVTDTITALTSDDNGGIWIGSEEGLIHYDASGKWSVFNNRNSGLPDDAINVLLNDGQGGVWIGLLHHGLAHYDANHKWNIFDTSNSGLASNFITALINDDKGGIWIGSDKGVIHYDADGKWNIINIFNNYKTNYSTYALLSDGELGLWFGFQQLEGSPYSLLSHYDGKELKAPDFSNSNMWVNEQAKQHVITSVLADKVGGIWVGGTAGLGHLRFTKKISLCQQSTKKQCSELQNNKRGAILIAGGGNDSSNALWNTTNSVSNVIYRTLSAKGFDNEEIYYLSPVDWVDFDGNGTDDKVVDAPKANRAIESTDIQKALNWAKQRGKLDQPLYIFFVDHGGTDKLQLSKDNALPVEQLKQMLDDYQKTTGNEVVLVIDACFSGVLGEKLKTDKRAIITSTDKGFAYFDRLSNQGFSTFLTTGLRKGMTFSEAFSYATTEQAKLLNDVKLRVAITGNTTSATSDIEQIPRKFDGNQTYGLDKLFLNSSLNADILKADATLSIKSLTNSNTVKANTPINLKAQASVAQGNVKEVWAVVRPPRMDLIIDSLGTPILAFPRVTLGQSKDTNQWETTWSDARYNGNYSITFYARDKDGDVVSSDETITLTVTDGINPPPQANLQIQLNQTSYKTGDNLKATITEELQWGYDLYLAVILPKGDFITLKEKNSFSSPNEVKTWYGKRQQGVANTFLELPLPALPQGQYCLFAVLSPQGESPLNSTQYWKQTTQCFSVN